MLFSYARIALRNLLNQKLYSCINIVGLAAGICCFLLIMLFVWQELGYDRQYKNADRIYRVALDIRPADGTAMVALAGNAPQVAALLREEFSEIEAAVRLVDRRTWLKSDEGEPLYRRAALVDADFFKVFDFQWLAGDPDTALGDPASVVLTASTARQLFGSQDILGRTLQLEDGRAARVTGVIADLPPDTHLAFDALVSIEWANAVFGPTIFQNWSMQMFHTYVLLREGASVLPMVERFPDFVARHLGEDVRGIFSYDATSLADIHLHSARRNELKTPGSMTTVRAFIAVAIVVLLVASINFMNLATVRAARRAREVGVRKAIGASRYQVMTQFLGEALLLTVLAVLLGVMCAELLLPLFNALIGQQLDTSLLATLWMLPVLMVGVAVISGSYPSFYLASFNAAVVLRGRSAATAGGQWFRKGLIVFQFAAAVALLIAAWVIEAQLQHARSIELGYSSEQVVVLDNIGAQGVGRDWDVLKQQLLTNPDILAVTASNSLPTTPVGSSYYFQFEGGTDVLTMPVMMVDFDYFETYGMQLLNGRTFSREFGTDVAAGERNGGAFILNESAVRQLGWTPEQALGKQVGLTCCGMEDGVVVGVVADVQHGSVQSPRGPVTYVIPPEPVARVHPETRAGLQMVSLKLSGANLESTLAYIDATWQRLRPDQAMSRYFLDEEFAGLYQNEERQGRVLSAFAILAVLITCMGLYGLSSYNALLRTKEIGVRKVMGGSVWSIVMLLTNDFSRLVLISNVIAWPVAWVAMNRWLENFAYRIDLTPMVFIGSGLIALCIAWVTVGGTAAKAANQKPVLALRYE